MIRVDADGVALQVERELAELDMFEFVLVKIRPTPNSRVDHVWETFAARNLMEKTIGYYKSVKGD